MYEKSDAQLLRETAELGSEAAFRELVERMGFGTFTEEIKDWVEI